MGAHGGQRLDITAMYEVTCGCCSLKVFGKWGDRASALEASGSSTPGAGAAINTPFVAGVSPEELLVHYVSKEEWTRLNRCVFAVALLLESSP